MGLLACWHFGKEQIKCSKIGFSAIFLCSLLACWHFRRVNVPSVPLRHVFVLVRFHRVFVPFRYVFVTLRLRYVTFSLRSVTFSLRFVTFCYVFVTIQYCVFTLFVYISYFSIIGHRPREVYTEIFVKTHPPRVLDDPAPVPHPGNDPAPVLHPGNDPAPVPPPGAVHPSPTHYHRTHPTNQAEPIKTD